MVAVAVVVVALKTLQVVEETTEQAVQYVSYGDQDVHSRQLVQVIYNV
jgi:hypothetical protein